MIARLQTLAILLILAAVVAMPLTVGVSTWLDHQSLRREWTAQGPACPVVAEISAAARGAKPPKPFAYRGATFAYQIGDVECAAVPEKSLFDSSSYTVCQFDAAGAVQVTAAGRTVRFEPGVGHGATVTLRKGEVSCIVNQSARYYGPGVGRRLQEASGR
ncbi:MAG TPA: hypothetical protein VIE16_03785 [Phenylobacterium sp.]